MRRNGIGGGGGSSDAPGWLARVALWGALCAALAPVAVYGQQAKPTEYQVKAAYLYNFGKFVEWPANLPVSGDNSFGICILGKDPFGPILDATISGETINGRSAVARRVATLPEAANCQILFISSSEEYRLKSILKSLGNAPVLTVSDLPQFAISGGALQFHVEDQRVRFEVNLTATEHAGLRLSSELLKVAMAVRRIPQGGD